MIRIMYNSILTHFNGNIDFWQEKSLMDNEVQMCLLTAALQEIIVLEN